MPALVATLLGVQACQPAAEAPCGLTSSVAAFEPLCETAVMVRYLGESRFFVEGTAGLLTAYLPEELESQRYGGTSGNALVMILSLANAEEAATPRTSWLTIGEISPHEIELHLSAEFPSGTVGGTVISPMIDD